MPNERGKLTDGDRLSPATEFKPGWRGEKACHSAEWLRYRHHELGQSLKEMAADPKCHCTVANIRFWMKRLGVDVRKGVKDGGR